jgi:flagellar hook protein FlgE
MTDVKPRSPGPQRGKSGRSRLARFLLNRARTDVLAGEIPMSLFGAMNTAISGLASQSAAFSNISDNIANSQTVGYKAVDTSFSDYLTVSNATTNLSGSTVATPQYTNDVQGTITQSTNPLSMAITGEGFFPVSVQNGTAAGGDPTFSAQQQYTRAGDFTMNASGYLVNSAGQYLNGWPVNSATNVADQTTLTPVQISQTEDNPVATSTVTLSANLPATPASGTTTTSQVQVYDSLGTEHTITLDWTQNSNGDWNVAINAPDNTTGTTIATADVQFGTASGNDVPAGTIGAITASGATASTYSADGAATLSFDANFGNGTQPITLNLGNYGQSTGLTQYAGTTYELGGISQNGVPPGAFQSVSMTSTGDVVVNYNNGQNRTIAQIPVVTFNDPDQLQGQNGAAYTATIASGNPVAQQAGSNGAGGLVTSSLESSNVDIASEFSKLIVAQNAYGANSKVITTSDQMLQTTINMLQ